MKTKEKKNSLKISSPVPVYLDYILSVCICFMPQLCLQVVETDRIIGNKTVDVSCGLASDYGFEH